MVTAVPTGPNTGDKLLIPGEELTVKLRPLLSTPPTVTTMLPVVAPAGTGTRIEVAPQLSGIAAVPLNVTVLAPCVVPKLLPLSVTAVPMPPCLGEPEAMVGPVITVNEVGLLSVPPTLTTTFPVVAPVGTGTMIDLSVQLVADATVPLNATVLLPRLGPKLLPVMVTEVPTAPEFGERLEIPGPGVTLKPAPLLVVPPTVTTTSPVVAPTGTGTAMEVSLQLDGEAAVPLYVIVVTP